MGQYAESAVNIISPEKILIPNPTGSAEAPLKSQRPITSVIKDKKNRSLRSVRPIFLLLFICLGFRAPSKSITKVKQKELEKLGV